MLTAPALLATFTAGLLSFFSPCTVPLIPAYLSYVSGVSGAELQDRSRSPQFRSKLLTGSVLYVAGFATVFVILGIGAGGIGHAVTRAARPVEVVGGILLIGFGLVITGAVHATGLLRERRLELPVALRGRGHLSAFPLGVVFGIGWTPCVGPYLGAALAIAALSAHVLAGGLLLAVYAFGLGFPFILVALAWASLPGLPRALSRVTPVLTIVGGVLTIGLGVLLVTGQYTLLTSWLAQMSVGY